MKENSMFLVEVYTTEGNRKDILVEAEDDISHDDLRDKVKGEKENVQSVPYIKKRFVPVSKSTYDYEPIKP